jgi:hypothetical protein
MEKFRHKLDGANDEYYVDGRDGCQIALAVSKSTNKVIGWRCIKGKENCVADHFYAGPW